MGEDHHAVTSSSRPNAVVVRQAVEEIWNQGNLDVADHLFAAEYVNAGGLIPDLVQGPEAIKVAAALHHTAFPRLHITIERMTSEGTLVAFQWVARNPPKGGMRDSDYASRTGTFRGMTFCRVASGKITESWTSWDASTILRKLVRAAGIVPGRNSPFLPA